MEQEILDTLYKKALGYSYEEVVEEYSVGDNGAIELAKKKVSKKHCPPDNTAMKTYIDLSNHNNIERLDDETLEKEKQRLLQSLLDNQKDKGKTKNENRKRK